MIAASPASSSPCVKLGYLISQYPAVSHTFILREVRTLRTVGFDIRVASINDPDRSYPELTQEEQEESEKTWYVKQQGVWGVIRANCLTLCTRPRGYVRGLLYALTVGGMNVPKILYGLFYFLEALLIGRWFTQQGLSHLHVHFATPASMVGLLVTQIFPITFSMTVHGPDEFYDAPGYCLREKIIGASFVCSIGFFARSQLMKLSPPSEWHKIEVSPLGVDLSIFTPRPFRKSPSPFEVLCVGRLVPAKGQQILLEAMALLEKEGRKVFLRIVGDGPDRLDLQETVAKRGLDQCVKFEGAVGQDRIRSFYNTADVFVLASFAEGIPVVLMEAMAMEIPCVTTWITGIPELIRSGEDGLLVSASDIEGLSKTIANLMDDEELRLRIGQAGRRRVADRYNLHTNISRLQEIFIRRLEEPQ